MKAKRFISLFTAVLMVVGLAAMFISCNNSDSGDGGSKMIVSVEVYSVDKDGNEVTDTVRTDKFDRAMEAHRNRVQNKNTDRVVRSYLRTIGRGK